MGVATQWRWRTDALPAHLNPEEWAIGSDGLLVRRVGAWSEEKLYLIRQYMHIFNTGMKQKWARRVYIDLFSGPGRVSTDDGEEQNGSALLALATDVPFTHAFLNDIEPEAINSLKARLPADTAINIQCTTLDCNEAALQIRRELPQASLDLVFIDPTNWQIRFDTLRNLTAGRRMDLIITFHVGGMKRAARYAPASLDAFFGTIGWREAYERSLRKGKREGSRILLDCYEAQLRTIGYQWTVDDVRITNRRHTGLYHLVFASKSSRGEDFWQKISGRSAGGQLRLMREVPTPYGTS